MTKPKTAYDIPTREFLSVSDRLKLLEIEADDMRKQIDKLLAERNTEMGSRRRSIEKRIGLPR